MMKFCDVLKHFDEGWGPHECSRIGHAFGQNVFAVCVQYGLVDLLSHIIIYFRGEEKNALNTMELAFFGYAGRNLLYLARGEQALRRLAVEHVNLMRRPEMEQPEVQTRDLGIGPADMNVPQGMATLPGGGMASRAEVMKRSFQQNNTVSPQTSISPAQSV